MKKLVLLSISLFILSCKNKTSETTVETTPQNTIKEQSKPSKYPEALVKVFDAHGGLNKWNKMKSLSFTMEKPDGREVTTVNLKNRKSFIDMPEHAIGFDGKQAWLLNKSEAEYKGNAKFYYNLMFYFYAMPFVLADDGIIYSEAEPLVFEGLSYPGIRIAYQSGVGESPEDEYVLYYNPETYKMEWLGYTVTFFTGEKEPELHFRKYSDWLEINGLLLPKTIVRYNYENNLPTTVHSENHFSEVSVSAEKPNADWFKVPEGATVLE
ncbi:DUF6503 family protein [Tamlana crocina]|uniref:Threonine synthase n=1 Tax=Tamlana crocina TaxID=393006 RepID=A0ABX1D969_9FLAO|nr:DUF6503 family protein [Tamlana crocina]NJX14918.1 hypothetical protein [Tamlana crocina]